MRVATAFALAGVAVVLSLGPSRAQETNESRLRDAVRQAVTEMRAAQDQAAQAQADLAKAQADLAKAQADKQALQTQLDAANAKLAEAGAKPTQRAPDAEAESRLRAGLAQNAALQQMNAKLQKSYQNAASQAQEKTAEAARLQATQRSQASHLQLCETTNTKLLNAAEEILHLYESQSFRILLLKSYEPVLGTSKVRLENIIQDYDDKIHNQEYVPAASPK